MVSMATFFLQSLTMTIKIIMTKSAFPVFLDMTITIYSNSSYLDFLKGLESKSVLFQSRNFSLPNVKQNYKGIPLTVGMQSV